MLLKLKQVLLRLVNSYINKSNITIRAILVYVLNFFYTDLTIVKREGFKLKEIQKDPFNDFVGDEPRKICPENIVIHIPHSKFSGPEIILGLRVHEDYDGKSLNQGMVWPR